jgi:hypothetical protein
MGSNASQPSSASPTKVSDAQVDARAASITKLSDAKAAGAVARAAEAVARAASLTKVSDAQAASMKTQTRIAAFGALCAAGAVAALIADFYLHESPAHIKRKMQRTLRACRLPQSVSGMLPAVRLPLNQPPLSLGALGFCPTLLQGPTGSGKSSVLDALARDATSGGPNGLSKVPTVLMRLRMPASTDHGSEAAPFSTADTQQAASRRGGETLMDAVAAQIFAQIGFPPRRSLIAMLLSRGVFFQGQRTQAELTMPESSSRLITALIYLFEICQRLQTERLANAPGTSALDAAPILLFDEVQDLIKDARLRNSGGELVLSALGTLGVAYGVDRHAVRVVFSGSSAELYFALSESSPARGFRLCYHDLADPTSGAMVNALVLKGYMREAAEGMVELCGTRLRLFDGPLTRGAGAISSNDFIAASLAVAAADYAGVFSKLDRPDSERLARLIDEIAAAETALASFYVLRPTKNLLWESVAKLDLAPVLFVDRARNLHFQSLLHHNAWKLLRGLYSAKPLLL